MEVVDSEGLVLAFTSLERVGEQANEFFGRMFDLAMCSNRMS